jgi:hypothetical protein
MIGSIRHYLLKTHLRNHSYLLYGIMSALGIDWESYVSDRLSKAAARVSARGRGGRSMVTPSPGASANVDFRVGSPRDSDAAPPEPSLAPGPGPGSESGSLAPSGSAGAAAGHPATSALGSRLAWSS